MQLKTILMLLLLISAAYAVDITTDSLTLKESKATTRYNTTISIELDEVQNLIYPDYARHFYRFTIKNDKKTTLEIGSILKQIDAHLNEGGGIQNVRYYEHNGAEAKEGSITENWVEIPFSNIAIPSGEEFRYMLSFDTPPFTSGQFNITLTLDGNNYYLDPGIAACGNLAAGNSYDLTADITNHAANCFTTTGNTITFDCWGHTVDSTDAGFSAFVLQHNDFTLKNCILTDWGTAINIVGPNSGINVQNVTATSNVQQCVAHSTGVSSDLYFNNNSFTDCGTNAFKFAIGGVAASSVVVSNSTIDATTRGFWFDTGGTEIDISNSAITANTQMLYLGGNDDVELTNVTVSSWDKIITVANKTQTLDITDIESTTAVLVRAFDYDTPATKVTYNLTITNNPGTTYVYDRRVYVAEMASLGGTACELTVREDVNYYPGYAVGTSDYLRADMLLMPLSGGYSLIAFHVQDNLGSQITNATVAVYKNVAGTWTLVSAKKTDSSGVASFYLETTVQYKVEGSMTGYSDYSGYITPSVSEYTITLSSSSGGVGFPTTIEGVRTSFTPQGRIDQTVSQTFNYTVWNTSAESALEWFSMAIYNHTTEIYFYNDTDNTSGGEIVYAFIPGAGSDISVILSFDRLNRSYTSWEFEVPTYAPYTSTGADLATALTNLGGFGEFTIMMITLVAGIAISGWVATISMGAAIPTFLGILTMGFLASPTILSGGVVLLSYMVAGTYLLGRGGSQ